VRQGEVHDGMAVDERRLERSENDPDALRRLGLAHLFILFISMLVIVALIVIASLFITTSARRAGFARAGFVQTSEARLSV
jgi:hypothetical protein